MSLDQTRAQSQSTDRVYEDFDPPFDWDHDEGSDTLILMLPGFRKDQLRVQITSTRILKLSGERNIRENKWRRFHKESSIPSDSDTSGISAKFEGGILYVRLPKVITPIEPQPATKPTQEAPKPQQPTAEAPNAQVAADLEKQQVNKAAEAKPEKAEEAPAPAPTPKEPLKEPKADEDSQKKQQKEKGKAEIDANKVAKEKAEATTSKAKKMHETSPDGVGKGEAKMEKRSPTMELLPRQTQEYKNAVSGLVEELKKQKKLANLLVVIFFALLFVLYIKNAIKSSFGGPKNQEL